MTLSISLGGVEGSVQPHVQVCCTHRCCLKCLLFHHSPGLIPLGVLWEFCCVYIPSTPPPRLTVLFLRQVMQNNHIASVTLYGPPRPGAHLRTTELP